MKYINFYPGPSKINRQIPLLAEKAFKNQVLEFNHRSEEFHSVFKKAQNKVRKFLKVPEDYNIHFVSSATESWEIIGESFIKENTTHIYNGAFGEKWSSVNKKLGLNTLNIEFDINTLPDISAILSSEIICLTHCETSNGTKLPKSFIESLREKHNNSLIAVDATASLGGIQLDISHTDIVFASVQKCFGLPAGLSVFITSPNAEKKAAELNKTTHYNSFLQIAKNSAVWETTHTPNILGIYMLSEMDFSKKFFISRQNLKSRAKDIKVELKKFGFRTIANKPNLNAETVICFYHPSPKKLIERAKAKQLIIGKGYGKWEENTIRIANFPSHTDYEFEQLLRFLKK